MIVILAYVAVGGRAAGVTLRRFWNALAGVAEATAGMAFVMLVVRFLLLDHLSAGPRLVLVIVVGVVVYLPLCRWRAPEVAEELRRVRRTESREMTFTGNDGHDVELTIVIPTRYRPEMLRRCIASLAQTEPAEGIELVVVVMDGIRPQSGCWARSAVVPAARVVQERARQAAARNRGVEEARGRFLLFLDDDIVAEAGSWPAICGRLSREGVVAMGRIDKMLREGAPRWARARQTCGGSTTNVLPPAGAPLFTDCYGANLSLARESFPRRRRLRNRSDILETTSSSAIASSGRGCGSSTCRDAVVREDDRDTLRRFVADGRRRGVVGVTALRATPELLPHLRLVGRKNLPGAGSPSQGCTCSAGPSRSVGDRSTFAADRLLRVRWLSFLFSYCYTGGSALASICDSGGV